MLIRNAVVDGRVTDLRLMHGAVQEMGVGLQKGLYESELDLRGDELRPCPQEFPLPRRYRRRMAGTGENSRVIPGCPEPLTRWREGKLLGLIDQHTAD